MPEWKYGKNFAFTIVDDTDGATVENIRPVYDYLYEKGIITTKTVWVYPPRDYFPGDSLQNNAYRDYILKLQKRGFEIAFHDAGSGKFTTEEIKTALNEYKNIFGCYPKIHINHGDNPSSIYWGDKRFSKPLNALFSLFKKFNGCYVPFCGNNPKSDSFWGDTCKSTIKYIRNRAFSELNILKRDKYMPYKEKCKDKYSNYWFSSSDGMKAEAFCRLLSKKNVDRLAMEHGCAVIYVHFGYGFVDEKTGLLREDVKEAIDYIAQADGWFAPASEILDYMLEKKDSNEYITDFKAFKMDIIWLYERIKRRIFLKV